MAPFVSPPFKKGHRIPASVHEALVVALFQPLLDSQEMIVAEGEDICALSVLRRRG
jgi:hypothetical protein